MWDTQLRKEESHWKRSTRADKYGDREPHFLEMCPEHNRYDNDRRNEAEQQHKFDPVKPCQSSGIVPVHQVRR